MDTINCQEFTLKRWAHLRWTFGHMYTVHVHVHVHVHAAETISSVMNKGALSLVYYNSVCLAESSLRSLYQHNTHTHAQTME